MRTFFTLGVLWALIVSGDEEVIEGIFKDTVLLPCNCSERNLDQELRWQMETPKTSLVFKHNRNTSKFNDGYKGRAKILLSENSSNCSLLLTNITVEDQGRYSCRFHTQSIYKRFFVYLNVSASYDVCLSEPNVSGGLYVFQCNVEGLHREARIQWKLHGQLLTNVTNITHTRNVEASPGLYRFNSQLSTKLNWTTALTCDVKAKDISATIKSGCRRKETVIQVLSKAHVGRCHYFNIIPIVLVLGISILLRRRWDTSQSLPGIWKVETHIIYG